MTATLGIGDVLDGKYAIKRVLGEGGMGVVYEAHHTKLDQPVAIKVMLPEMLAEPTLVARFEREARAAAKLKSRHVARVFDVDVTGDGLHYIVMELLHGHDLAHEIATCKQLPVGRAVHILLQVCAAIHDAHRLGIVHRDLKPANVFLAQEGADKVVAKVLDFGISKDLVTNTRLTNEHGIVGTVLYMSPEQVRNDPLDHRTDIWSLGAMFYEMLAGAPPFDGPVTKVAAAIVSEQPTALRELRPDLPSGLGSVVRKLLAKDANDRYPDVRAVMEALAAFSPSQDLTPYLDALVDAHPSGREMSSPAIPGVTADTLDAADRVMAPPRTATTAGLSSERLLPRSSSRGRLALLGLAVFVPLGAGAAVVALRSQATSTPAALSASAEPPAATSASASAESAPIASAPGTAATAAPSDTAPGVATTVDAGKANVVTSTRTKKGSRPTTSSPNAPPPAPSPPATPTKGSTPPWHL